ncbi:hypothetical protein BC830DRAFT_1229618 [Chytriomyces sp. MP71]|nr:hypothetical protein BC830DRAFT_1229618 [Chytriomyces sp. MP71]
MSVLLSPVPAPTQFAVPPLPRVFKRPRSVTSVAFTSHSASTSTASTLQPHSHSLALALSQSRTRADQGQAPAALPLRCGARQRMNAMSGGRPSLASLQMVCDSDSDGEADHMISPPLPLVSINILDSPPMRTSTLIGLTDSTLAANSASATATAGAPIMTRTPSRPRQNALSSKERPSLDLIEGQ